MDVTEKPIASHVVDAPDAGSPVPTTIVQTLPRDATGALVRLMKIRDGERTRRHPPPLG
jgi:hypothetical protein